MISGTFTLPELLVLNCLAPAAERETNSVKVIMGHCYLLIYYTKMTCQWYILAINNREANIHTYITVI